MKQLMEALRGAKRIEILVIIAMLCVLLVLAMNPGSESALDTPEKRLERILGEIEGAGRVKVMLLSEGDEAQGCVVAAEGADDIAVMLRLQRSVQALTNLELNRIEIVKSKR